MVLEREIERHLEKSVAQAGGMCLKFVPDNCVGMPDRLVVCPDGRVLWVETKKPVGGKLAPIQIHRHNQLRELKQTVVVCWTKDDVNDFVCENFPDART